MMLKPAPLSPPREAPRSGQMPKAGNLGGRICPSPKFDSTIVAFGGGWEGASFAKLFILGYLQAYFHQVPKEI